MAPVRPAGERIEAIIDALRGCALVGIFFINITTMRGAIYSEHPNGAPNLGPTDHVHDGSRVRGLAGVLPDGTP